MNFKRPAATLRILSGTVSQFVPLCSTIMTRFYDVLVPHVLAFLAAFAGVRDGGTHYVPV